MAFRSEFYLIVLLALAVISPPLKAEWATVERVYDGDTFLIEDGTKIRVLGIDTPETHHPKLGREPGGEAATRLARYYLEGKRVWLSGNITDVYGRRLAHVRLEDKRDYAEIIRKHGYDKRSKSYSSNAREKSSSKKYKRIWVGGYFRKDGTWVSGHYRRVKVKR